MTACRQSTRMTSRDEFGVAGAIALMVGVHVEGRSKRTRRAPSERPWSSTNSAMDTSSTVNRMTEPTSRLRATPLIHAMSEDG